MALLQKQQKPKPLKRTLQQRLVVVSIVRLSLRVTAIPCSVSR